MSDATLSAGREAELAPQDTASSATKLSLVFENDGEIDVRAAYTFGVSIKEHDNPIGFFGTGLKYALAILLRAGHEVTIQSGLAEYHFSTNALTIRGEQFDVVIVEEPAGETRELGFTTDVGKTWEVWMAYRELACNCLDEKGRTYAALFPPSPISGTTRVIVRGDPIILAHANRREFILDSVPLFAVGSIEVHPGSNNGIFYRGLRVMRVPDDQRTAYTYNLLGSLDLTEDRTAKYPFMVAVAVRDAVIRSENGDFIRRCLTARKGFYECGFDFDDSYYTPSGTFLEITDDLVSDRVTDINRSAVAVYKDHARKHLSPATHSLTDVQQEMLTRALAFAKGIGFEINYPIIVTESLGSGTLGLAEDGRIFLSAHCFLLGTKQVAATAIEEYIHLKHQVADCTRGFQDLLLNKVVSLGEELRGSPL